MVIIPKGQTGTPSPADGTYPDGRPFDKYSVAIAMLKKDGDLKPILAVEGDVPLRPDDGEIVLLKATDDERKQLTDAGFRFRDPRKGEGGGWG